MNIRDPLVHATYYYLRAAPEDSPSRRQDRHAAFVEDARHVLQTVSGWLSMAPPTMPDVPAWEGDPPATVQPLARTSELQGRTNASAWLGAYALHNMLLLRVIVLRTGEYPETIWAMLDESLGTTRTAPSWLHTTRYWCGVAPRPPEDLEHSRFHPVKTPFGVLCLGRADDAHVLVYPDARTEQRASAFLESLAAELDWHAVQVRHRLDRYRDHAAQATRNQQQALEQVTRSIQSWGASDQPRRLQSLAPLYGELDTLESTYIHVLNDLAVTRAAAQELSALVTGYRLLLMQHGLWDAAPSMWEAQVSRLAARQARIEADVAQVEITLQRIELTLRTAQTRIALLQGERDRFLIYLIAVVGVALLVVLLAATNPVLIAVRVVLLALAAGAVWVTWRRWQRAQSP